MKEKTKCYFNLLFEKHIELENMANDVNIAFEILMECYKSGGKVLICGNGGSAADSEHIAGELLKGFLLKRQFSDCEIKAYEEKFGDEGVSVVKRLQKSLPAIPLVSMSGINSAVNNDIGGGMVFAQQAAGFVKEGDVLIAMSTSGNAENCINAAIVTKMQGGSVIGITGENGGKLASKCDICMKIPERETYLVQELTLPLYHTLCMMIENEFFGE